MLGQQRERCPDVNGAAQHPASRFVDDGQGLAGETRLVEHGPTNRDASVDGNDVADPDEDAVARDHRVDGHHVHAAALLAYRGARLPGKQRGHLPGRASRREGFERLTARVH